MSRPSLLMPVLAVLLCGARTQEPDTDTLIRLDVGNTSSLHHLSPRVVKLRLVGEFEGLYLNVSVGEGALGSLSQIVEQLTATYRIPAAESRRLKHFLFIEFASAEIDWAQDRLSVEPGEPSRASGQSGLQRLTEALEILVEQHESETQTLERRLLKVSKVVVDQKSAFRDQLRAHREEVSTLRRKMSAFEAESTQITAH